MELLLFNSNTWNYLTMQIKLSGLDKSTLNHLCANKWALSRLKIVT